MLTRLLIAGLSGYFYGKSAADPVRRANLFASLALQEAEGSRSLERIREAKAAEIPGWLDDQLVRHIGDEARHARILRRAVALEGMQIDEESQAARRAIASLGEGSLKRFHQSETLEEVPLANLLAGVLVAELAGVRAFRTILRSVPETLTTTRSGLASILADEERHVRYLSDALRRLGSLRLVEEYGRRIEGQLFQDFGRVWQFLTTPNRERPVLVKPGSGEEALLSPPTS